MASARSAGEITPGTTELTITKAVYVGTGGVLVVEMVDGGVVTFTNTQDGQIIPIRVRRILATDGASPETLTTATGIVALY